MGRSSLLAEAPEVAPEVVLEVVQRVPSAMMDQDQPARTAQPQPVTMGPPLFLTETCSPSRVLTTASLTTALMARGQTPALMAAPLALADPEARGAPRRREKEESDLP